MLFAVLHVIEPFKEEKKLNKCFCVVFGSTSGPDVILCICDHHLHLPLNKLYGASVLPKQFLGWGYNPRWIAILTQIWGPVEMQSLVPKVIRHWNVVKSGWSMLFFFHIYFSGSLPNPKRPRVLHATLIMKDNVSSFPSFYESVLFGKVQTVVNSWYMTVWWGVWPNGWPCCL